MRARLFVQAMLLSGLLIVGCNRASSGADYQALVKLFDEVRQARRPVVKDGVADYTPAAIDFEAWPVTERVDYLLVQAELDGLDFELGVRKPWSRDLGEYNWHTGSMQIIWRDGATGKLHGVTDPRRLGLAAGF